MVQILTNILLGFEPYVRKCLLGFKPYENLFAAYNLKRFSYGSNPNKHFLTYGSNPNNMLEMLVRI